MSSAVHACTCSCTSITGITVQCLYCLASHDQIFYRISAISSYSCSNSIDTAALNSHTFSVGVKERYEPHFFFWSAAASFTSSFTSARVFGVTVPDRGPLQLNMPSAGRQCSLGSLQSATPTKATCSAYARAHFGSH